MMDDLDRALSSEETLTPSSGFTASVMDAVRKCAPPPSMPFPWGRWLAGFAASLVWAFAAVSVASHLGGSVADQLRPLVPDLALAAAAIAVALFPLYTRRFQS